MSDASLSETYPHGEPREIRLKRMKMRSMRRGIKEMDIILMRFCETRLEELDAEGLDLYDAVLSQNDQDLYQWVSGQAEPPEALAPMIARIAER
ncbi:antitoxin CptB [Pseudooceanicola antarcticus]|uniref:FAD assembly factor SdhE n=1 Tax=Pseudooceanicola antarcticus TaxID=1247613 RepID=A0A285IUI5_9RHOB|nr:succinate dehydrogenase assembly factor 2 [Pseudooceanicola antarcticus]PJE31897.1 succinate dehydrogenase assembly factor 2 [Pseudooceanicola antarcticus]SNY50746.1 antitoxin CptB [Pseudooceanicola antarcticus]